MWREIFYFINYTINPHAIPTFLTAAFLLGLGMAVVVREKASKVSLSFFYLALTISWWLFSFSMMYCAEVASVALFWAKLGYVTVPFIPVMVFFFSLAVLQLSPHYKSWSWASLVTASFFSLSALATNHLITHVQSFYWGYYPQYGGLRYPFLAFFFLLVIKSILQFWEAYKNTPIHSRHHHRVALFLLAFIIATFGSIDYLIKFGVPIYPIGFIPILVFALVAAATISRFDLQDISPNFALNDIMDHLSDALLVLDKDSGIRVVNEPACRLFQLKEKELIGKSIHSFVPEMISSIQWNDLIEHNLPIIQSETKITLQDGKPLYTSLAARTMKNKNNERVGIVCLIRDLSEIKKANEARQISEAKVQRLFDSNIIGIVFGDVKGNLTEGNEAFLNMMGYTHKDLPCKWTEITPPEWLPKDEYAIKELKMRGGATPYEKEYLRKDGSRIYILIGVALLPGSKEECVAFILDITEQKEAETKIKELNLNLEKRVEKRTHELKALIEELEAFSYSVSHDLRTPLTMIDGFTKILAESHQGALDQEGKNYLNYILKHTQKMQNLIDDLLTYSHLGRKEITEGDIDLESLFLDVFNEFKPLYSNRKFQFKLNPLPHVIGDEIMLRQVVTNLISNAIKYTGKKEVSLIEIGYYDNKNEPIFYVKDNGIGFSMHEIDKLFTVFQRLHPQEEFEGVGAGLAIVKRILERHGGKIWADSKVGVGTTFYFSLPSAAIKKEAA